MTTPTDLVPCTTAPTELVECQGEGEIKVVQELQEQEQQQQGNPVESTWFLQHDPPLFPKNV